MSEYKKTIGSRAEVFHSNAKHTSGGLCKEDLMMNKSGHIVSKRRSQMAKANYPKMKSKLAPVYTKSNNPHTKVCTS